MLASGQDVNDHRYLTITVMRCLPIKAASCKEEVNIFTAAIETSVSGSVIMSPAGMSHYTSITYSVLHHVLQRWQRTPHVPSAVTKGAATLSGFMPRR